MRRRALRGGHLLEEEGRFRRSLMFPSFALRIALEIRMSVCQTVMSVPQLLRPLL